MPTESIDGPSSTAVLTPAASACPWKKTTIVPTCTSFRELMDSDLAEKLQREEDEKYAHDMR